jgi:hypothetical protein
MDASLWKSLLTQWSSEVLDLKEYREGLPSSVVEARWLGYTGATEEQISEVESRLHITLPLSYRTFLEVTNGWRLVGSSRYNLWSIDQIDWLFVRNQSFIDMWIEKEGASRMPPISDEEYFLYGDGQNSVNIRGEYLKNALQISEWENSAIFLLIPQVNFDGEWEAWFYANWLPGAERYRSFGDLLQTEYEVFHEMNEEGLL